MLLKLARHWFRASPDEVAQRVPDPARIRELVSFLLLEEADRKAEEAKEKPRPPTPAEVAAALEAEAEAENERYANADE